MESASSGALIGRDEHLERLGKLQRELGRGNAGYAWIAGDAGSGKSRTLHAFAERARQAGWEVLSGACSEETRTDPYGPFLSMLGLCFDRGGRLINDRSVYSVVDQISLDDVFDAVTDIPGMSVVAFGIKVGVSIFETRRRSRAKDELLNHNFEFILQVLQQIGRRRQEPVLVALDDLHLASATTYALLEYILRRIQDTSLFVVATWQASSPDAGLRCVHTALPGMARPERLVHLGPLSEPDLSSVLDDLCARPLAQSLASTLVRFSRGMPGLLAEGLRLIELEGIDSLQGGADSAAPDSVARALVERQLSGLPRRERALLECASSIGQRVPLEVVSAPPLCAYLGMSERELLTVASDLADRGVLLAWDGEDSVGFTSPYVYRILHDQSRPAVTRRDQVRVAESWQTVEGESRPARLAKLYLEGGDAARAFAFAVQSGEELMRSAAYPEAIESYRLATTALEQLPEPDATVVYDTLRAMSLAAEQAGDWGEALAILEEALPWGAGDPGREAEVHAGLGWLWFQRGEIQSALTALERSAGLYALVGDVQGRAQVDYYRGVVYGQQKEWERAAACFERYLDASKKAGLEHGRASAYIELGNLFRLQRNWSQAEAWLRQGIELAEAEHDLIVLAQGYNYLGSCYALQGRPEAIETLQQALDIVRTRTRQPAQESRILNTLGETLVRMNRWTEAEEAFRASAAIKERLGDRAGLAMTYGGLGRMYLRQWRFDLAVSYLERDISLLEEEPDANAAWIQQWINLVGEARRLQGDLDRAEQRFGEALSLLECIPDREVRDQSEAYTRMLMARLALDRADLVTAATECESAARVLVDTWADGEVRRTQARLARAKGDLIGAREHLGKALAAAERGEPIDRGQAYLEQARLYRDSGDTEKAQEWAGRTVDVARELQNAELERQARRLQRPV